MEFVIVLHADFYELLQIYFIQLDCGVNMIIGVPGVPIITSYNTMRIFT